MLEECGLEYRVILIDITKGDQFKPEFLAISPNNRMPASVDYDVSGEPLSSFESGAVTSRLKTSSNCCLGRLRNPWAERVSSAAGYSF